MSDRDYIRFFYLKTAAANQILAQSSSDNGYQDNDAQYTMYQVHIKQLADENRRLQQELKSRTKTVDFDLSKYDSSDGQYKNLILEIVIISKKNSFQNSININSLFSLQRMHLKRNTCLHRKKIKSSDRS